MSYSRGCSRPASHPTGEARSPRRVVRTEDSVTLLEEIYEQPDTIAAALAANEDAVARAVAQMRRVGMVMIAARGSSDNAARYAQYVWGVRNRLAVGLTTPSLFSLYGQPPRLDNTAVVGISQSGESPDIVAVLAEARSQGCPTIAMTNVAKSPLAETADVVIDLNVGHEKAVAATKTFTAQLAVISMISEKLDPAAGRLDDVIGAVREALALRPEIRDIARQFAGIERAAVLGRGYHLATAFEWALKLQELSYVVAQPYSGADFLHGPIALVTPGYPVLGVVAEGPTSGEMANVLDRCRSLGASVLAITNSDAVAREAEHTIRFASSIPEWRSPIPATVLAQLFSYELTRSKGLDTESPRGLRKVTKTV